MLPESEPETLPSVVAQPVNRHSTTARTAIKMLNFFMVVPPVICFKHGLSICRAAGFSLAKIYQAQKTPLREGLYF